MADAKGLGGAASYVGVGGTQLGLGGAALYGATVVASGGGPVAGTSSRRLFPVEDITRLFPRKNLNRLFPVT